MSKGKTENGNATMTIGIRTMLTGLTALIVTLFFSLFPAMAGGYTPYGRTAQRLVFSASEQGLTLVSAQPVPSRRLSAEAPSASALELAVVDKTSGRALSRHPLTDPLLVHADTVVNGELTGGPSRMKEQLLTVVVPSVGAGQRIEINGTVFDGLEVEALAGRQTRDSEGSGAVETVHQTGHSANRLDILVMGDGYTTGEMGLFDEHVETLVAGLLANEPFNRFSAFINIHKLEVASNQSGTDQPDQVPPVYVDTAFNSSFNYAGISQLLYADTAAVLEAAAAVPEYDTIILVVNTSRYGGGAGAYACFAGGSSSAVKLALHEFGHSFGGLTDEYQNPYDTYSGPEPTAPNCTAMVWLQMTNQQEKWHHWLGIEGVGLFEGCEYYAHGKSRPCERCLMRSLDSEFDPVCRELIALALFGHTGQVESRQPEENQVTLTGQQQIFSLQTVGGLADVQWFVDGEPAVDGSGAIFQLWTDSIAVGDHQVEAVVTLTDTWMLDDPDGVLTEVVSWTVTREAELQSFAVSLEVEAVVHAGQRMDIEVSIVNIADTARSFQASLDLTYCDGSRINGFRRGSGTIQPGGERLVNVPVWIPAEVPARLLDCPLTLDLVVTDTASDMVTTADGSFTIQSN